MKRAVPIARRNRRARSSTSPRGSVLCLSWMMSAPPRTAAVAISMTRSDGASGVITYRRAVPSFTPPSPPPPPLGGGRCSGENLAQLVSERLRGGVAVARMLDHALQVLLELVVVHAVGTAFEVQLDFQRLGVGQLAVDVAVELVSALFAFHVCDTCVGPPGWTIPDSTAYS